MIEPLLVKLTIRNIGVQAHCNDTAIILTNNKMAKLLKILTLYNKSLGAKLNKRKSVVITTKATENCPFQQSKKAKKYLGFFLSPYR